MSYINRRFSHEKRVVHLAVAGDPTLTLDYKYLLNSGSSIAQSVLKGPTPTFTRASDAFSFDSSGNYVAVGGNDLPRFIHDPANGNAKDGLLFERAETNLCLQSSNFGTTWSVGALNVDIPTTNNSDIFGTTTADEIATTNTADEAYAIFQDFTGRTANAVTCCAVHVKTGTNVSFVQLAWDADGGGADGLFCNFQLTSAGTAGTVTALAAGGDTLDAFIDLTTDGFYRCVIVGEIDAGTTGRFTISMVDRIDAGVFEAADLADNDSIIVCAADVQVGNKMTSHIPTTTVSVTRAVEACSTTDIASWHSADTPTTWFVQWKSNPYFVTDNQYVFALSDGSSSDREALQVDSGASTRFLVNSSGGGDANINLGFAATEIDTVYKVAAAYTTNDAAASDNGDAVATDPSVDFPTNDLTVLNIGGSEGGIRQINGPVQALKHFDNVRKPNAFLVSESTL